MKKSPLPKQRAFPCSFVYPRMRQISRTASASYRSRLEKNF